MSEFLRDEKRAAEYLASVGYSVRRGDRGGYPYYIKTPTGRNSRGIMVDTLISIAFRRGMNRGGSQ